MTQHTTARSDTDLWAAYLRHKPQVDQAWEEFQRLWRELDRVWDLKDAAWRRYSLASDRSRELLNAWWESEYGEPLYSAALMDEAAVAVS